MRVSVRGFYSLVDIFLVIDVIQEWYNYLVPAGEATISLHRDEVGQPGNILDLLLLDLEIGVEAAIVELLFEGHRESLDRFFKHDLI